MERLYKIENAYAECYPISDQFIKDTYRFSQNIYENFWIIHILEVPKNMRNKGFGRKILEKICSDADFTNTSLLLEIHPWRGIDFDRLKSLYVSYNFEFTDILGTRLSQSHIANF